MAVFLPCQRPLLERCPFCEYALEGLPEQHVCPECGQEYDKTWRVFGLGRAWRGMNGWELLLCWALLVLNAIFGIWVGLWDRWMVAAGNCGSVVVLSIVLWRVPRHIVAVGRDEIIIWDRSRRMARRYDWSRVGWARRKWTGTLLIVADGRRVKCDLGSLGAAWRCALAIRQERDRWTVLNRNRNLREPLCSSVRALYLS